MKKFSKKSKKGQILIELIVAITLAAIIIGVGAHLIDLSLYSNKFAKEKLKALYLLQEYQEALENIVKEKWHLLYNLSKGEPNHYYLDSSTGKWVIQSGEENINLGGISYQRYFIVEDVFRLNGDINPSGNNDPSTQKITIKIFWNDDSLEIFKYLTRWPNELFVQTDWSGGEGQLGPITSPNDKYWSDDGNIDVLDTPGSIKLKYYQ